MRFLRKSFVSLTIIILSVFFVTVIIAMNSFNSQIKYSNERGLIEKQVYYNAYAGIQKGIYEIRMNKDVSIADYFSMSDDPQETSPQKQKYFTFLKVSNTPNGSKYQYVIESTGYGKFKQTVLSQKITAKITVDYVEKTGIIRVENIEVH